VGGTELRPIRMATNYKLGPLPWSRDTLVHAYWTNWVDALENVKEHPGFAAHEALQAVQMGVDLFIDNTDDLLSAVVEFKNAVRPGFFARGNRHTVEKWDRKLRKHFFSVTSSAFALVDTYRSVTGDFPIEGYNEQTKAFFTDSELHNFMQGLRNFCTHKRLLTPSWQITLTAGRKVTEVILTKEKLEDFHSWTPPAKAFIQKLSSGVDIERLVREYRTLVRDFYNWFQDHFWSAYDSQINEYLSYEKILKGESWKVHWRQVLDYGIRNNLNPYHYLDRHLTPDEIRRALALPHGSREQIDLMISMADEFKICDDEIREMVLKLFSLAGAGTRQKRSHLLSGGGLVSVIGAVVIALVGLVSLRFRRKERPFSAR
jgi:hypothetical protein